MIRRPWPAPCPSGCGGPFNEYLKCGILAHGFARVYCANCHHDLLVAFSCKGRDLCPSGATRRMAEVSAHLVDQVLPRVQHRQWVLSVPRRVRWRLRHQPEVISGLLTVFLRAVETTIRQRSPGASPAARFGAAAFVHRFVGYLNSHVHFHVLVTDGVFSAGTDGEAIFHPALDLTPADFAAIQAKMCRRCLRWLQPHGTWRTRRPPPQGEFQFDQTVGPDDWPEMVQTAGQGDGWVGVFANPPPTGLRRLESAGSGVGFQGRIDGNGGGMSQSDCHCHRPPGAVTLPSLVTAYSGLQHR